MESRDGSVASHPDVRDAAGMSAMPSIATQSVRRNEASRCATSGCEQSQQIAKLFDHLVGAGEQHRGNFKTESLRGCQIDNEIELGRLLDRDVARLRSPQDFIDILGGAP